MLRYFKNICNIDRFLARELYVHSFPTSVLQTIFCSAYGFMSRVECRYWRYHPLVCHLGPPMFGQQSHFNFVVTMNFRKEELVSLVTSSFRIECLACVREIIPGVILRHLRIIKNKTKENKNTKNSLKTYIYLCSCIENQTHLIYFRYSLTHVGTSVPINPS